MSHPASTILEGFKWGIGFAFAQRLIGWPNIKYETVDRRTWSTVPLMTYPDKKSRHEVARVKNQNQVGYVHSKESTSETAAANDLPPDLPSIAQTEAPSLEEEGPSKTQSDHGVHGKEE
ncbi:hypothetical protein ACS0TY_002899 [Phlomoides rotata]